MKTQILFEKDFGVVDARFQTLDMLHQFFGLRLRATRSGQFPYARLQETASLQKLLEADIFAAEALGHHANRAMQTAIADEKAAGGDHLDDVFCLEDADGLTQHRPADLHSLAKAALARKASTGLPALLDHDRLDLRRYPLGKPLVAK